MLNTLLSMDPVVLTAFMAAALILNITPGSDVMFTVASSLQGGMRPGIAAATGISCGSLCHAALAAFGLSALLQANPTAYEIIKYLGAGYLFYLAWVTWHAPMQRWLSNGQSEMFRAYKRGFLTNILNPKVALFTLAFLPQFVDPSVGPVWHQMLLLGIMVSISGLIVMTLIAVFSGLLTDRLKAASSTINKLSAVVFGAMAGKLVFE